MKNDQNYVVSQITKKNKNYIVTFTSKDQSEDVTLNEDQIVDYRLIKGVSFTKTEFNKIKKSAENLTYYNKVLHYIDFKPRTKDEVKDYLKKLNVGEKEINDIIQKLIKIKYIDDERYTTCFVRELINKNKGRHYILQTLQTKGIDKKLIIKVLDSYDQKEERENALKVANKLLPKISKNPLKKQTLQIQNHLYQAGFSFDIINYVLASITLIDESDETLQKEYQKLKNKNNDQNKIIASLLAKGFDYSNIKKIINDDKN